MKYKYFIPGTLAYEIVDIIISISRFAWFALVGGFIGMLALFAFATPIIFLTFACIGSWHSVVGFFSTLLGLIWHFRLPLAPYLIYCIIHPEEIKSMWMSIWSK